MNFIKILINKINQFSNTKKQILQISIPEPTNIILITRIIFLMYFYGYIQNYFFFKFKVNESTINMLKIILPTKTNVNMKYLNTSTSKSKPSLKHYKRNASLNTCNTFLIKHLTQVSLYPYSKILAGKLYIKIK